MKRIGIIGAMDEEVSFLKSIAENKTEKDGFVSGTINGTEVVIVMSGIGKVNAALCAQRLILEFGVTHVINTGIAGAAAHGLTVLDMVASTDAVYHDFDVTGFGYKPTVIPRMETSEFKADEKMLKAAEKAFAELKDTDDFKGHKLISGRIASGDQFISNKQVKNHIIEICNPACVEMEGAAIAHACFLNKTPFLILRCMSDCADDGEESTYDFNDKIAANMSAKLVQKLISGASAL
ncbi:5'-methylthioadenosine/adenosylhomocysteine nucleosidase [Treponema zioleckii]|uniref:5'-methylthioadenosine/adenosylhomocysteine nucleosidase n=1 Tax=Treponema zioleckii TaxID=331680 RepID=UPI00168B8B64|nr:5'-methylthioadenosine/adenosylhomocysteine nucleosidase [Treponema zioleckii]